MKEEIRIVRRRPRIKIFKAEHPSWQDELCLLPNGRMRRADGEAGTYQLEDRVRLLLQWDRWPPEELFWQEAEQAYRAINNYFVAWELPSDQLRVNFVNFWPGFRFQNFLHYLLPEPYSIDFRLSKFPQLVFESVFGARGAGRRYWPEATQVWFTGENIAPPLNQFDYCLSFHRDCPDPCHLRWPLFLLHLCSLGLNAEDLRKDENINHHSEQHQRFCAFIAANEGCQVRNRFVQGLSEYRKVDCPGSVLNNMPPDAIGSRGDAKSKIEFLRQYKFVVCFENTATRGQEGYVTEKIIDAMLAGSIPLYWGDHRVGEDFNVKSFVDLGPCGNDVVAMVQRVIQIDQDETASQKIAFEPWFTGNEVPWHLQNARIGEFFQRVRKDILAKASIS